MRNIQKKQRDIQRTADRGICTRCGGELYPGQTCWRLGGWILCEDCLVPWLVEALAPFRGTSGEVKR